MGVLHHSLDGLSQLTVSIKLKVNSISSGQVMGLVEKSNGQVLSRDESLGKEYILKSTMKVAKEVLIYV